MDQWGSLGKSIVYTSMEVIAQGNHTEGEVLVRTNKDKLIIEERYNPYNSLSRHLLP
jgi:hypothetical protein